MKTLVSLVFLTIFSNAASAQVHPELKGDTLYYQGDKFYKGKMIMLGHGTAPDRTFNFVSPGAGFFGTAPKRYNGRRGVVEAIKSEGGKNYLKAQLESPLGKVTIELEGAIDSRELLN